MRVAIGAVAVALVTVGCATADDGADEAAAPTTAAVAPECSGAPSGGTFRLVPRWQAGEVRRFELTRTKAGPESTTLLRSFDVTVEVLAVDTSAAHLRWTMSGPEADLATLIGATYETPEEVRGALAALGVVRVDYTTDASGAFTGVENRDELRAYMSSVVDALAPLDQRYEDARDRITSDPVIDAVLVEDITVFHAMHGGDLDLDAPTEHPEAMPNAFGGEPFPGVRVTEATVEAVTGCLTVDSEITVDPDELRRVWNDMAARGAAEPVDPDTPLALTARVRYRLDPETGWPLEVETEQATREGDGRFVDRTELEPA